MMISETNIAQRLATVQERIDRAAARSGRAAQEITLVAVTKTWPAELVLAAHGAGLRHFGENRVEELTPKRASVEATLGGTGAITWHAIGPLQSRKSDLAADHADVFHALDRLKIARRLSRRLVESGRGDKDPLPFFLEVNLSGEVSKAGMDCANWEKDREQRQELLSMARATLELPGLAPMGLMMMAPWKVGEEILRDLFRRTRELGIWLGEQAGGGDWSNLSMGMTDDFEIAIEEGATHIRVGRALFGSRV